MTPCCRGAFFFSSLTPLLLSRHGRRVLFINGQRATFLRVQLSRVAPLPCSLFAITSVLDIDGILTEMCNSISDKDRFRPD